jgi:hypothetical protein
MFGRGLVSLAAIAAILVVGSSAASAQEQSEVPPVFLPQNVGDRLPDPRQRHPWVFDDAPFPLYYTYVRGGWRWPDGSEAFVYCLVAVAADNPRWQQEDMRYTRFTGGARCNYQMGSITGVARLHNYDLDENRHYVLAQAPYGSQHPVPAGQGEGWQALGEGFYTRTADDQFQTVKTDITIEMPGQPGAYWDEWGPNPCQRDASNPRIIRCNVTSLPFTHVPYPCPGGKVGVQPPGCTTTPTVCPIGDTTTEDCIAADSPPAPWFDEAIPEDAVEATDAPDTQDGAEGDLEPIPAQLVRVNAAGDPVGSASSVAECFNSIKAEQALVHRAEPPPRSLVRWRTKAVCYGPANVVRNGYSRLMNRKMEFVRANGSTCQASNNGFACRSKGAWVAADASRRRHTIYAKYYWYAPSNTRWRANALNDKGITYKTCSGYGTSILVCDLYRWFSSGVVD